MQQHTAKANKRNKNIAALQLQLWNSGAFKGVIDKRTGKQVTYERAVDGYDGRMTRQAQDNYQKIRESINIPKWENKSEISSNHSSFLNKIPLFRKDSQNTNLHAIFDNQKNKLFKENYGVLDKQNALFSIYNGDSLVYQTPVILGKNKGDGLTSDRWNSGSSGTTGAGVFKVFVGEGNKDWITNEKQLQLISDDDNPQKYARNALHSPASQRRLDGLKLKASQRRMSNGCFSGNCGTVDEILNNRYLDNNSIVYVLPEIEGNNLIEKNGKIEMSWGTNNPETYVDNKGITRKFRYNKQSI